MRNLATTKNALTVKKLSMHFFCNSVIHTAVCRTILRYIAVKDVDEDGKGSFWHTLKNLATQWSEKKIKNLLSLWLHTFVGYYPVLVGHVIQMKKTIIVNPRKKKMKYLLNAKLFEIETGLLCRLLANLCYYQAIPSQTEFERQFVPSIYILFWCQPALQRYNMKKNISHELKMSIQWL